ncbi:putative copper-importing P-type ATPase A [Symmachiella dynata]|uniref:cation-translocating P-type ATPase family protein n=1 Tax=Symmachiella dynata TaxID=2527995 RepID=UPI00118A5FD0|nr:cation-translocating P-type ATPase family protein [Symmachiella dynata]QDT47166.1 putative copper-importing P-type ATPase A [Symmachiella dynata]
MHYVPESARAFLESGGTAAEDEEATSFHYVSAPLYLLTAIVGALLAADFVIQISNNPTWEPYQTVFGFRLALLAAVIGGARILYQTLEGLFDGRIGADLALTIACLAAIILGEPQVAALVVFIAICGESIEGYTNGKARQAVLSIFNLRPKTAHVIRDGDEVDVDLDDVAVGELVVVRPGERIPVDGSVLAGTSAVDQSSLTGESLPIDKVPGDEVFAGTLNQFGALSVEVEKTGEETTFGQVLRMVAEAMERKAPIERTADRLARYFLPFVLTAAAATLVGWRIAAGDWRAGLMPALGVLVVACPCPLILATPSAVMAALAWLARNGVVTKGSIALERLAKVDCIAFDKTGTLTRGEPALGGIVTWGGLDETELLRIAAAAEKRSEHVLARLIVREAEGRMCVVPDIEEFEAHPGCGVTGAIRGSSLGPDYTQESHRVVVGNRRLLESMGIVLPEDFEQRLDEVENLGPTQLLVTIDGQLVGAIGVRDTLRPEARKVLAELRAEGIESFALLTGDRAEPAQMVADALEGIDEIGSELLPTDKARWIEAQTKAGKKVAMIGDGINDAPALASATVGLALGGVGSDVAAEAGDLVLMGDPLTPLPGLLRLSRQLVRVISQSIYLFAFGMNGLGVILCAWGILSPVGGAIFHEFASLAVMLNSMRLLWFERWDETRLGRSVESLGGFSEVVATALSPSRLAFGLVRHWKMLAKLAAAALLVYWLTSNLVVIREDESALVTRFGRQEAMLSAGIHFRWPAPLEVVRREKFASIRTIPLGFRAPQREAGGEGQAFVEWQSEHTRADYQSRPEEALILTGDEVPVEITAEVHYRIRDLKKFAYASADPETMLRAVAETKLRGLAAHLPLNDILTSGRQQMEADCLELTQRAADDYDLGVELTGVNLLDVHPPIDVVPAYRDVADAMEMQQKLVNDAQAYYARNVLEAAGEDAIRVLSGSTSDVQSAPTSTTGGVADWSLDDELWAKLTTEINGKSPLSGQAASKLHVAHHQSARQVQSAVGEAARFESLLSAHRSNQHLTRTQMYWDTVERVLSVRPLTIIDSKVAGRQNLYLLDPDRFGAGNSVMLPQAQPEEEQPLVGQPEP